MKWKLAASKSPQQIAFWHDPIGIVYFRSEVEGTMALVNGRPYAIPNEFDDSHLWQPLMSDSFVSVHRTGRVAPASGVDEQQECENKQNNCDNNLEVDLFD